MQLQIISWKDLIYENSAVTRMLKRALLETGIVGIKDVPDFMTVSQEYIKAARKFARLEDVIKKQYIPDRDSGITEGYEMGAERFMNDQGIWHIDDKKASYYAVVPDHAVNIWPCEMDLKTSYMSLGELIFNTGKLVLDRIGINERIGIPLTSLTGYGRMLHYHKTSDSDRNNPDWCGAHLDHGVFTGLMPAWYFRGEAMVEEPEEAGLFIFPTNGSEFQKVQEKDKSLLFFQVGEFGQLASHDAVQATRHLVKKAYGSIERYTYALFFNAKPGVVIHSKSRLTKDVRYLLNQFPDGSISWENWEKASFEQYRAETAI